MRPAVVAAYAAVGAAAVAILLASQQRTIGPGEFEYGTDRPYSGRVYLAPTPVLDVGARLMPLVATGKFGAAHLFPGLDGAAVSLRATRIHRDGMEMLEVADGSVRAEAGPARQYTGPKEDLGEFTFAGEIVDSKCYLGVMNPGDGHVHRECAVRCISGGVPPLFVVRDGKGRLHYLWLTGAIGTGLLDYVAEPVRVSGHLSRQANLLYFETSIPSIQRE